MSGNVRDLTGLKFGALKVLRLLPERKHRWVVYECACDCGSVVTRTSENLRRVKYPACTDCQKKRRPVYCAANSTTHGHIAGCKPTAEYRAWRNMLARCYNLRVPGYKNYGAVGVSVCGRWRNSFAAFLADVGLKPSPKLSLDRINPFGNYEPGNVRWADAKTQANNKRKRLGKCEAYMLQKRAERAAQSAEIAA